MSNSPDDFLGPPPPRTSVAFGDPPLVRRSSSDANRAYDVFVEEPDGLMGFPCRSSQEPRIYQSVEPAAASITSVNRRQRMYYPVETNNARAADSTSNHSPATVGTGYDPFDFPEQTHAGSTTNAAIVAPLPTQQPRVSRMYRNDAMYRRAGPAGRFVGTAVPSRPAIPTTSAVGSFYDQFDTPQSESAAPRFEGAKAPLRPNAIPATSAVGSAYDQFDAPPSDSGVHSAYDAFDATPEQHTQQVPPLSPRLPRGSGKYTSERSSRARSNAGPYSATHSRLKQWLRNSQADRRYQQARHGERAPVSHPRNDSTIYRGASEAVAYAVGSDGLSEVGGGAKDWNAAWQQALELPEVGGSKRAARWERLARLSADFKATAENYTRVIVMERNLPDSQKVRDLLHRAFRFVLQYLPYAEASRFVLNAYRQ